MLLIIGDICITEIYAKERITSYGVKNGRGIPDFDVNLQFMLSADYTTHSIINCPIFSDHLISHEFQNHYIKITIIYNFKSKLKIDINHLNFNTF